MNLVLIDPAEITDHKRVVLDDRRARHLREVVRVRVGDRLRVGLVRGPLGEARVEAIDGDRVVLGVTLRADVDPPTVDLVLAVPRPKVLSRVLEAAAAFGVRRIDLVNAWRVDKSYLGSRRLEPDRLDAALRLGCEQGGTSWLPEVELHPRLMGFLDRWPPGGAAAGHRLIAHPRAETTLEAVIVPGDRAPVIVAVGPEGGWIDRELESFAERGFVAVGIGPRTLRVESAVAALFGQLDLLRRMPLRTGSPTPDRGA